MSVVVMSVLQEDISVIHPTLVITGHAFRIRQTEFIIYTLLLLILIRPMAGIAMVVSPSAASSNIISLPLAFVRSGYINLRDGKAYVVGRSLYGWSRVAKSLANAYNLGVNPTNVGPSNNNNRYHGFPLRCLYLEKWKRNKSKEDSMRKL